MLTLCLPVFRLFDNPSCASQCVGPLHDQATHSTDARCNHQPILYSYSGKLTAGRVDKCSAAEESVSL